MKSIYSLGFGLAVFCTSTTAFAFGACENLAKTVSLATYTKDAGTIQGSNGPEAISTLLSVRGDYESYLIEISDNNEDGETWVVRYQVTARKVAGACQIISIKK